MPARHGATLALVSHAHAHFGSLLETVSDSSWSGATPCEDWDVGQLVDHVAGAALIYAALLGGASFDEAMGAGQPDPSAADRRVSYRDSVAALDRAFGRPGAMTSTCDVPGGPITGAGLATVRVFDVAVHSWDLARAVGGPEQVPGPIVERALRFAINHYGDEAAATARASASQHEDLSDELVLLLRLSGRAPSVR